MDIIVKLTMPGSGAVEQRLAVRAIITELQRLFPGVSLSVQSVDEAMPEEQDDALPLDKRIQGINRYGGL